MSFTYTVFLVHGLNNLFIRSNYNLVNHLVNPAHSHLASPHHSHPLSHHLSPLAHPHHNHPLSPAHSHLANHIVNPAHSHLASPHHSHPLNPHLSPLSHDTKYTYYHKHIITRGIPPNTRKKLSNII